MQRVSNVSRPIGVCVLNEPAWQHSLTESETRVVTSYVTPLKRCHVISARISQTSWNIITSSVMYRFNPLGSGVSSVSIVTQLWVVGLGSRGSIFRKGHLHSAQTDFGAHNWIGGYPMQCIPGIAAVNVTIAQVKNACSCTPRRRDVVRS
jgi:hypothetical protein